MADIEDVLRYRSSNKARDEEVQNSRKRATRRKVLSHSDVMDLKELKKMGKDSSIDMGELLTENQDRYCYLRAIGYSRRDAVRGSGSMADANNLHSLTSTANRWEADSRIKDKIASYKEEVRTSMKMDQGQIVAQLQEVYQGAMAKGDYKTAKDCLNDIALMTGNATKDNKQTQFDEIQRKDSIDDLKTSNNPKHELKRLTGILVKKQKD